MVLMCGCFAADDSRMGFTSASSEVAIAGANLPERPAEIAADRRVVLTTEACDHLILYIYIIPHTLPAGRSVDAEKPFEIELAISAGGHVFRTEQRAINQWSGASIEMRVSAAENQ